MGRNRARARWAGWTVVNIDVLAASLVIGCRTVEKTWNSRPRDIHRVRHTIREMAFVLPLIEKSLSEGPPPPKPQADPWGEIEPILENFDEGWDL